jgi:hypothetical protein
MEGMEKGFQSIIFGVNELGTAWHVGLVMEKIFDNYLFGWDSSLKLKGEGFWCCLCI